MTIRILQLERRRLAPCTGDTLNISSEYGSWKQAWQSFRDDYLHDRACPNTKVQRYGPNSGIIQHWGDTRSEAKHNCAPEIELEA